MLLQVGEMQTKDLIQLFGTDKLKERYQKDKRLGGGDKKTLLNKAKIYCHINDLGNGKYYIKKVYGLIKDDKLIALKKGIYNYMVPVILNKLIKDQDHNYSVILPFIGWAKRFEIVNDNYATIKYNQDSFCKQLNINEDIMFDYFERMDNCIRYYLRECLNKLEKMDLVKYNYFTMAKKKVKYINDKTKELKISCTYTTERLTPEEEKFVIDCENEAKYRANIILPKEKFFGQKSIDYKKYLGELLSKENIVFTYPVFEIFCKDYYSIIDIIDKFETKTEDQFIEDFNLKFIEYSNNKSKLKIEKDDNYKKDQRLANLYLEEINKLTEITIKRNVEIIELNEKYIKDSAIELLLREFNIKVERK